MRTDLRVQSRWLGVRRTLFPAALCATLSLASEASAGTFAMPIAESLTPAADMVVSGTVTDTKGEPLPGVNIVAKGTTNGTQTDAQGNFSLTVPDRGTVLVFSFIGYRPQEVAANSTSRLTVQLSSDDQALDEVVVVGYGSQSRATVTGAVSAVKSEDIIRTPAAAATSALVGRVPGISARQADARPGNGTSIQIRNLGNPLYVIDGIVADEGQFNNLGINDIDNVSVLKDASAAIYGLRAANGVILVTTKRGKKGKPTINLSGYYGVQNFTQYPQPANAYQHQRALVESEQNLAQQGRRTPGLVNDPVSNLPLTPQELEKWRLGTEPGYQSYDYYKMVLRPNVPQYYVNGSFSGGSDNVTYYISGSHLGQEALIKDFHFKRTNLQANVEANVTKRLKLGTQISARVEDRHQTGVPGLDDYFNPLLSVFSMWPTESPYANNNPAYINQTHNVNVNPATYKEEITGYIQEYWRAGKVNLFTQYDFDFGLSARATGSYNFTNFDFDGFEYTYNAFKYDAVKDTYFTQPGWGNQNPWRETRRRNVIDRFGQLQLTYNKQLGDHGLAAVAAYERYDTENKYNVVHTVPPNNTIPIQLFASQDVLINEYSEQARAGYIGRVSYNYKQKYLVEFLSRYDGSFLFAPGNRYGFFPAATVGWRLTEEPFVKERVGNVLSELKLRGSYGRTGSDLINNNFIVAPYSYVPGYDFPSGSAIFNGNYTFGVRPRGLPITTLSWVTNISSNIGLDFGFLDGRITGQFDVFERRRTGLPAAQYDILLPSEVGYSLPQANLNSDAVRGMEGSVGYSGAVGGLTYTVGVNATLARNRDLEQYKPRFGNSWDEYRNSYMDRWANIGWGYQVIGQFKSQEEIGDYTVDNDGQGNRTALPGDFIYKDVNNDKVINGLDERPIGYIEGANPLINYAFTSSLGYKGFSLNIDIVGAGMQTFRREVEQRIPFQNNGTSPAYMFEDRWHHEDPYNADSPWVPGKYPAVRRDNAGHSNYNKRSDFWISNVRYLRLRNLELGYNLPKPLLSKVGASAMRIYVNATNLYVLSSLKDIEIDPEVSSNGGLVYPVQRLFNTGFSLSF